MSAVRFKAYFTSAINSSEESKTATEKTIRIPSNNSTGDLRSTFKNINSEYDVTDGANRVGGDPRVEEKRLFIDNYEFIWKNREKIINDNVMFETPLYFSGLSIAYLGGGSLTLGMLLDLWNNGDWTTTCPDCGGVVRIVSWGGSPLSGNNRWHGFCPFCKKEVTDTCKENFIKKVQPARILINNRREKYLKANPDNYPKTASPKVVNSNFQTFSRKCTELKKHFEENPPVEPDETTLSETIKEAEDIVWYSPLQVVINLLKNSMN